MRTTYYGDDSFLFEFEDQEGYILLHCKVYKWKLSTLKKQIDILGKFLNDMEKKGVDVVYAATKNLKFASLLGGEYIMNHNKYEVVRWVIR